MRAWLFLPFLVSHSIYHPRGSIVKSVWTDRNRRGDNEKAYLDNRLPDSITSLVALAMIFAGMMHTQFIIIVGGSKDGNQSWY